MIKIYCIFYAANQIDSSSPTYLYLQSIKKKQKNYRSVQTTQTLLFQSRTKLIYCQILLIYNKNLQYSAEKYCQERSENYVFRNKLQFCTYIPYDPKRDKKVYPPTIQGYKKLNFFEGGGNVRRKFQKLSFVLKNSLEA